MRACGARNKEASRGASTPERLCVAEAYCAPAASAAVILTQSGVIGRVSPGADP